MLITLHDRQRRKVCTVRLSRLVFLACCVSSVVIIAIFHNIQTRPRVILYPKTDQGALKRTVRDNGIRTHNTTTASVSKVSTAATTTKGSIELKFNHKNFTSFHKMAENISKITWKDTRFKNIIKPQLAPPMLQKNVSILCMVTSTPRHEMTRAMAVNKTWGGRCTKVLFVFTKHRSVFEHVSLDVPDGRKHLTAKTMTGFRHIHKQYGDEFDWIVKADDDTYLIVENLRFLLSKFDPNEPAYLGYHFKVHVHNGYMSGGGSYVLSKAALRMLAERGFTKEVGCSTDSADEDVEVGRCLEKLGVKPFMTRDKFGRDSFHPQSLAEHMVGPMSYYLVYYPAHPIALGPECCSQLSISFHYVQHQMMYIVDMLLYRISVHGLDNLPPDQLKDFFIKNESKISHTSEKEIYRVKGRHKYNYFIP